MLFLVDWTDITQNSSRRRCPIQRRGHNSLRTYDLQGDEVRDVRRGADLTFVQARVRDLHGVQAQLPLVGEFDPVVEDLHPGTGGVDKVVDGQEGVVAVTDPGNLEGRRRKDGTRYFGRLSLLSLLLQLSLALSHTQPCLSFPRVLSPFRSGLCRISASLSQQQRSVVGLAGIAGGENIK